MTEREEFFAAIEAEPNNFVRYSIFSDWLIEHGEEELSLAFKWCGKHKIRPSMSPSMKHFYWAQGDQRTGQFLPLWLHVAMECRWDVGTLEIIMFRLGIALKQIIQTVIC